MAKYHLTNKAVEDISTFWSYTFDVWSEMQADKYYKLLLSCFTALSLDENLGKNYPEIDPEIFGYKMSEHIIFYRMIKKHEIEIVRILHSRMDLKNRIGE